MTINCNAKMVTLDGPGQILHHKCTPLGKFGRIADEQRLLASSTTEGQGGGNVRSSAAAIERDGDKIALERNATVISFTGRNAMLK